MSFNLLDNKSFGKDDDCQLIQVDHHKVSYSNHAKVIEQIKLILFNIHKNVNQDYIVLVYFLIIL